MIKYLKVSVSFEMAGELITRVTKKDTSLVLHKCYLLVKKNRNHIWILLYEFWICKTVL